MIKKRMPQKKKQTKKPVVTKTPKTKKPVTKKPAPKKVVAPKKPAKAKPASPKAPVKKTDKRTTVKKTTKVSKTTRKPAKPKAKPVAEKKPQRLTVVEGTKKASAPLVVEPYPKEYTGLPFLTLIQFRKQPMLVIIDNVDETSIKAYVLDLCGPERVDEEKVILAASEWFQSNRTKYPISIEFSRRGMTPETSRIYRTFDVEFVSRIIGPAPEFPMTVVKSVKRRRRKPVPPGVEIMRQGNVLSLNHFFS